MMDANLVKVSKFLSLVLRHQPEAIGLTLDANGWAEVEELIACATRHGRRLTVETIARTVASNDKQRFALSEDRRRIRANQGHSVDVDLALAPCQPPEMLFHGTATRFLESIRQRGLLAGRRQHVHLSADEATAIKVGQRHGKPVVLRIRAGAMHRAGKVFHLSANGVWLTEHVPAEDIDFGAGN